MRLPGSNGYGVVKRNEFWPTAEEAIARARQALTYGVETKTSQAARLAGKQWTYKNQIALPNISSLPTQPYSTSRPVLEFSRAQKGAKIIELMQEVGKPFNLRMYKRWTPGGRNGATGIDSRLLGKNYAWEGGVGFTGSAGSPGVVVEGAEVYNAYGNVIWRAILR